MGIQGLGSQILKNHDGIYETVKLKKFYAKTFAVDVSGIIYQYLKTHGEKKWINPMIKFLSILKKNGLNIICVFDGKNVPPEKNEEKESRNKSGDKVYQKYSETLDLIEEIETEYIDEVTRQSKRLPTSLAKRVETLLSKQRDPYLGFDKQDPQLCLRELEKVREKFGKQCIYVTVEHSQIVKEISKSLGIPIKHAYGEAETVCSYLAIKHSEEVDGVISNDSDVLAYGTPLVLSNVDVSKETVRVLEYKKMLSVLELTSKQFLDLCIICKCDYNKHNGSMKIPAKKKGKFRNVGPKIAFGLIKEYESIENMEEQDGFDITPLNYKRCRQLLTVPKKMCVNDMGFIKDKYKNEKGEKINEEGEEIEINYDYFDKEEFEEILKKYKCKIKIDEICKYWQLTEFIYED